MSPAMITRERDTQALRDLVAEARAVLARTSFDSGAHVDPDGDRLVLSNAIDALARLAGVS